MKPQILDRYFFQEFLKNFIAIIIALLLIAQVTKITESLAPILKYNLPPSIIAYFYFLYIPVYITLILAPALLFAVSVTVAKFFNSNEMAVIFSGGRSLLRVLFPIIIFSFLISLFIFFFSEWVTYPSTYISNRMWWSFGEENYDPKAQENHNLIIRSKNRFYTISYFSVHEKKAKGIHIVEISPSYTTKKIYDFERAEITEKGNWIFYQGFITDFDELGNFVAREFYQEYKSCINDPPEYFRDAGMRFEEKNFIDLAREMKIRKLKGENNREHLVEYHWHFSFPFVAFLLTIVGSLLGKHLKRGAIAISFAMTTAISIIYFLIMFFGKSLGVSGLLSPFVGAWFANIIFIILIVALLYHEHQHN